MKRFVCILLCFVMLFSTTVICGAETTKDEGGFVHPGLLHTKEDLDRISEAVKNGEQPYLDGWNALLEHWLSKPTDRTLATETVDRTSGNGSFINLGKDMARAYQCALRWKIEGNQECGDTARNILNSWAEKLESITGNDRYLVSGLYGYQLANAAELMRDYQGFELEKMQNMLINVFYKPLCERFLLSNEYGDGHNGAYITEYWANWDLANVAALVSIGVFCDRRDIYEQGIEYYRYGDGNGAIYNAIPHLFPGSLAQNQESGRDQGHNTLSIGLLGVICETAWNQGDDIYSWADNRLMYAAEYVARYNNGHDVPFELYEWGGYNGANQTHTQISSSARGAVRPIWEILYNHYENRMGYDVPNIKEAAEKNRPESGATGNFDIAGFGTLLFTREKGTGKMATPLEDNLIEEGVYRIIVKRTQKALTADYDGVTQKSVGNEGQEWIISSLGSGQYTITNAASGLSLGSKDGSYDPKTEMVVSEYTGDNSQKFTILPTSEEGYYRITPIHTSKALDVLDNSNQDGAKIIQWRYLYNANQQWRFELVRKEDTNPPVNIEADRYYVTINGLRVESDVNPINVNGRLLVPLRAVFEAVGAIVEWNDATKTVLCKKGDKEVRVIIGSNTMTVNGLETQLDAAAEIVNGRTMVPLRAIAEGLDATVTWRSGTRTAELLV